MKLKHDHSAIEQLFRRMVLNVLGGNIDDHTKNFSFLMDRSGKWTLAPAYDMVYGIAGKTQGINKKDLALVGARYQIHSPERIINDILDIVCRLDSYLIPLGVGEKTRKMMLQELNEKHLEL